MPVPRRDSSPCELLREASALQSAAAAGRRPIVSWPRADVEPGQRGRSATYLRLALDALLHVISPLLIPLQLYRWAARMQATSEIAVNLPLCPMCECQAAPQPIHVDFANARMTFLVHRNLRDRALSRG